MGLHPPRDGSGGTRKPLAREFSHLRCSPKLIQSQSGLPYYGAERTAGYFPVVWHGYPPVRIVSIS